MKTHPEYIALRERLYELAAINPSALGRVEELGQTYGFKKVVPVFEAIKKLFGQLVRCNLDDLPDTTISQLISYTNSTGKVLADVQKFNPKMVELNPGEFGNKLPAQVHEQLIQEVENLYQTLFGQLTHIISYCLVEAVDQVRLREEVENAIKDISEQKERLDEQHRVRMSGVEEALEKVQQTAQKVGVAAHAEHFKEEARLHEKAAQKWLIATVILAVLTLGIGIASFIFGIWFFQSISPSQSIQVALAKIAIFSFFFSSLIWTGRIYRSQKHNAVVNKHRQNALSTFETFAVAAGDDPQVKNAVLLQATQCIFSPQHTGYIAQESDTAGYPQVLEIVRGIASPPGKN
ncbi:MAG: hypothetical protein JNK38_24045 [Acidobacteria bacterium]|nr:hypothetical protein [Acidobacteriota bacterium]